MTEGDEMVTVSGENRHGHDSTGLNPTIPRSLVTGEIERLAGGQCPVPCSRSTIGHTAAPFRDHFANSSSRRLSPIGSGNT